MIRVLHYGMSPNLGGIETYLLNLSRTIDASRFQFDFLYSDYGQEPIYAPDLPASRFYGVTPRRVSPSRNRRDLDDLFARESFDILHFHANTASYVEPVKAALRHGVRVVFHSHNAGASRSRLTRALHRWNELTLPWSRITRVAVSGEAGRWMYGSRPFDVIHNGIDVSSFTFTTDARAATRSELGIADDEFVVGSVAAFLPAKNHDFLLDVFSEVYERNPRAKLILVGSGPLEAEVRRQVDLLQLANHVRFLGRRTDVPRLLAAMDILLLPSKHEGFPLVALEAQASGLPCALSDAITSEVDLPPFARRVSLRSPPVVWADAVLRLNGLPARQAGAEAAVRAGLTTSASTKRVSATYQALLASPT